MQFFGILFVIGLGTAIPIITMWGQGQFVGQKPAPGVAKIVILSGIALGLVIGGFRAVASFGSEREFLDWLEIAWIAGSGLAAFVALQESMQVRAPETES